MAVGSPVSYFPIMSSGTQRRLAAIVVADVVGYSRLMGADEMATLDALRGHRSGLIDPLVSENRGRIVKTMGDGLLLEFPSIVDAVRCSVEVQKGMVDRNATVPDGAALRLRIGVHLGDIIVEGADIFGDGVNIAARIEALADPGGVAISDDAHRHVQGRLEVAWRHGGTHHAKNIARPISIWRWSPGDGRSRPSPATRAEALAPPDGPSIAVLPFDNMSGDRDQEYFSDGITEDIITEISRIPGLLVISRNSTFTYKGKPVRPRDVCRDLGVRYVLEGSVRRAGDRVRITAQLIDGQSDAHLWAERYDRDLVDIFAVQDDVTARIVEALEVKLSGQPSAVRKETDNTEAYDCVLRGRERFRLYSRDSHLEARRLFERAIELDPNYAAAYAGLALTALHEWFAGSPKALDQAYELALEAQSLEPSLPAVYEALGNVSLFRREYDEAVAAARQWVRVEPGNADAYANLAGATHFSGEHEDVIPLVDKAIRLNPFYPFYYVLYRGQALLAMERYEEAIEAIDRAVSRNPDALPPHLYRASCLAHLGREADARAALAEVRRIVPAISAHWVSTIFAYKEASDLNRLMAGLRRAGLSE